MNKLGSFDDLLAEEKYRHEAIFGLDDARTAIQTAQSIIQCSWQHESLGLEEERLAFHEAVAKLEACYSSLFRASCSFEAEAQTLAFLAQIKNYIVKDPFVRLSGIATPPAEDEDHAFDRGQRDSLLRAIESSFAFQSDTAPQFVTPILDIVRTGNYKDFDRHMKSFADDLAARLTLHEMALYRQTGRSLNELFERLNNDTELSKTTGAINVPNLKPTLQ